MTDAVTIIDTAQLIQREVPRDQEKIKYWCNHLRAQGSLPPIEVMPLARAYNSEPRWLVWNGHHRIAAAKAEGALCVAAKVLSL